MKPITKVLFGIVAICGLLQSIGFGLLLWPNREFTRFYVQQAGWLRPVMIGLTAPEVASVSRRSSQTCPGTFTSSNESKSQDCAGHLVQTTLIDH